MPQFDESTPADALPANPQAGAPPYLTALNPEQRRAVEALDGPVLVLAGAGTGKTRVLTTRIGHILATRRAFPSQILAVTFTNKAAREMRERVGQMVGGVVEGMPWLGTFHSLSAKILRRHAELVGLKSNFTILDTDDQIRLLKQLLEAEGIDPKRWPARVLAGHIDRWKNRGWGPEKVPEGESFAFADGKGADLYRQYQERLKVVNAADFGDLLLEPLRLFQENPDVLRDWQRRFRYILVDEYQDTNVAQYLWLRLLAQGNNNICCVGDDDQSIYGWRGAEVDNILRFEKDFPGAQVIRLERNYRSTKHILGAAAGLINANKARLGKTLWTEADGGDPVQVRGYWDGTEEARNIADAVEVLQRDGHNLSEMAILVRASFQMREFEDHFIMRGLSYRVIGGPRFYERMEVRDANAYFRVVAQPDDDLAFERIINTPKRGIGKRSEQIIHRHAREAGIPLTQAARTLTQTEDLPAAARKSLKRLLDSFDRWRDLAESTKHTELAEIILDESGYTAMWQNDRSAEAAGRLDNLRELVRSMEPFENLTGYLEHIALVMEAEQEDTLDKVSLMTLHSAKGLEFDCVFLPGWEEELLPHRRSLDESGNAGLEEERRLAHVGITRARKRAHISFAANRQIHGSWQSALPSRFIGELPEEHIDAELEQGLYGGVGAAMSRGEPETERFSSAYDSPGWARAQKEWTRRGGRPKGPWDGPVIEAVPELVATSDPSTVRYAIGCRIFHQKFGYGKVVEADGNKLTIDFEKAGRKRVIDSFVEGV